MVEGVVEKRVDEILKKHPSISPKKPKSSARNKKNIDERKKT